MDVFSKKFQSHCKFQFQVMYTADLINNAVIHLICFTRLKCSFTCCTENQGEPCIALVHKLMPSLRLRIKPSNSPTWVGSQQHCSG